MTKDWTCTAYAMDAETGNELAYDLKWSMVEAEGWDKKNPKWKTMPELMMRYRSAAIFSRLFFPDVIMGMYTADELEDIHGKPIQQIVTTSEEIDDLDSKLEGEVSEPEQDQNDAPVSDEEAIQAEIESTKEAK